MWRFRNMMYFVLSQNMTKIAFWNSRFTCFFIFWLYLWALKRVVSHSFTFIILTIAAIHIHLKLCRYILHYQIHVKVGDTCPYIVKFSFKKSPWMKPPWEKRLVWRHSDSYSVLTKTCTESLMIRLRALQLCLCVRKASWIFKNKRFSTQYWSLRLFLFYVSFVIM